MKIVVLGASGGCGRHLVSRAKDRGHEVTAVVRGAGYTPPAGVDVRRGDLTDVAFLRECVRGRDAVLSALGLRLSGIAPWNKPEVPDFLAKSTPAIVEAMKAEGVRRVLAISAGGVGDSRDKVPTAFRIFISTTALKRVYPELETMERIYFASGLDVTIPRPTGLTDGPVTGQVKVVERLAGRATISRADVAAWMLDELEKPAHGGKAPMITVTERRAEEAQDLRVELRLVRLAIEARRILRRGEVGPRHLRRKRALKREVPGAGDDAVIDAPAIAHAAQHDLRVERGRELVALSRAHQDGEIDLRERALRDVPAARGREQNERTHARIARDGDEP